ncbi:Flagellar protein (FlbD) [compost metagenome]
MIKLHRLNGSEFIINADHIEIVEATPDTVITLTNEHKWVVRETPDEVIERIVAFKRRTGVLGAVGLGE